MMGIKRRITQGNTKSFFLMLFLFFLVACAKGLPADSGSNRGDEKRVKLTIDLAKTYQQIDNFGASDAWSTQFVGQWPDEKRQAMADLLFSQEMDGAGNPKGIGLSLWRFNIGAGSAPGNTIGDEWRSAESFLQSDGSYDWEKQAGQQWFLRAAKARGVEQFLAFPNSPPISLTKNGKAFASQGVSNLASSRIAEYAAYLSQVLQGVSSRNGVSFRYISPVNEPQWDWSDGGQEGSPFTNLQVSELVKSLDQALQKDQSPTKIVVAEAAQYEFLYADHGKPGKGKQVEAFFNPASAAFIGDLSTVEPLISGHSYFTSSPSQRSITIRQQVARAVEQVPGLRFWQSEYCILGDNQGEIDGNNRDLGMNSALYVARTIHHDLVFANATAWQWWLAISPYAYKDGLIYVDKSKTDGNYYSSKIMWALGNYSRFIRPGARRLGGSLEGTGSQEKLLTSSYRKDNQLVTVLINQDHQPVQLDLTVVHGEVSATSTAYITTAVTDLERAPMEQENLKITLEARSVTTLVTRILN